MTRQAFGLVPFLLGGALTACRTSHPTPGELTLTLAMRADVTGFFPNPPIFNEAYTIHVNSNIFEGLVRFDEKLQLQAALAERWENPDARTYVFELRRGLRFSDGRAVTAADVAASLEAALKRRWVTHVYLQNIESVRAVGPARVEIHTRGPDLILLYRLPWGFVLPATALDATPVPVLGTGPYSLESWTPGREFVFKRNPHHRGPPPEFERARFVVVPDDRERIARVMGGEADLAESIPLDALDDLQMRSDVRLVVQPGLRVLFLGMRMDAPPFSDPRVREALDLALDREVLIRSALRGRSATASQVVPRSVVGFNQDLAPTRPDKERARKLLVEAGHPRGLALQLDGPNNRYVGDVQILEEVARQLALVGIRVTVNAMDKREFFPLLQAGRSPFHLLGWACESGDAGNVLDALFHSPTQGLGGSNTLGLADPELDGLIDASNRAGTFPERTLLLQKAVARVAVLRPVIPLVIQTEAMLLSRRVVWDPPMNLAIRLAEIRRGPTAR